MYMRFMPGQSCMPSLMLTIPLIMQPLSLEDLLKKKQIEQDEATKVAQLMLLSGMNVSGHRLTD